MFADFDMAFLKYLALGSDSGTNLAILALCLSGLVLGVAGAGISALLLLLLTAAVRDCLGFFFVTCTLLVDSVFTGLAGAGTNCGISSASGKSSTSNSATIYQINKME